MIELHCHSYYSFLDGTSSPEDLVLAAKEKGITALALTDRDGLYGVSAFYKICKEEGIHPIIGAQLTMACGSSIVVLAKDQEGYRRLSTVISQAYDGRDKGDPLTRAAMLRPLKGHAFCLVNALSDLEIYRDIFGEDAVYLEVTHHLAEGDTSRCRDLKRSGVPCVATNAVRYATSDLGHLHDVLRCIKERIHLEDAYQIRPGNTHRCLKSRGELEPLIEWEEPFLNAEKIAAQCDVSIDFADYRFPDFPVPEGRTPLSYLTHLCDRELPPIYQQKRAEELALIDQLGLAGYFLVVWDIVSYARREGIPVQGRGSAANSLVAYLLGITPIDPVENDLYLGRFLHEGMTTIPDIDLDFASRRDPNQKDREDVIQYVYEKYGKDHVAMVATFVTFRRKSAVREVGRVLNLPQEWIDLLARRSEVPDRPDKIDEVTWTHFWHLVEQIKDIPRHMGVHVGGMLIASCPIANLVPLEPARMEGRVVCQWDKDMVDDAGLIKVDILGLGMLAVLREAEQMVPGLDLLTIPNNDPAVFEQIGNADTIGTFQIESRAQMQSLPRTKPRNFPELGIQVALIRPGPLQGNMVSPYIKRKQGSEPVSYPHPSLEPILKSTLGVILFQEQVLQVASAIAGFTPGQSEELRRAMSRKRSKAVMERLSEKFLEGARKKGLNDEDAERILSTLAGFASYGFCKSHALSFARITYLSAWMKRHHPAPFAAALVSNQPMGFYSTNTILEDAKRHGVTVLPPDVNESQVRCIASSNTLRLGLERVHGLHIKETEDLVKNAPFHGLPDLIRRTNIRRNGLENLIQSGACDRFGLTRRELLWQLWLLENEPLPLLPDDHTPAEALPFASQWETVCTEHRSMGCSTKLHPVALLRSVLNQRYAITSKELRLIKDGLRTRIGGLTICRQKPPTAKGFAFLTVEDEEGMMNIIVAPQVYQKYKILIRESPFLIIEGICQSQEGIINLKATHIQDIPMREI
jgi:error-prone DNA polymerase